MMLENVSLGSSVANVSETTDPEYVRMTRLASLIAGYYMAVILFLGTLVNALVLNTFRLHPEVLPPNSQLIKLLCAFDLAMTILSFPFICASCIANRWLFSDIGCQWYGYSMTASGLSVIATLTCIAFQRYHVIVGMRRESETVMTSRTKKLAVGCFLYGAFIGLLPFFGVGSYALEPVFLSCSPTWWSKETHDVVFTMILFSCAFFIPVSLIVFSYTCIFVKVFRSRQGHELRNNANTKLAVVSLAMIVFFLVSWGPYAVMAFLQAFEYGYTLSPMANTIPVMMAKSCVIWDPLIYVGGNEKFRKALLHDLSHLVRGFRSKSRAADYVSEHMVEECNRISNILSPTAAKENSSTNYNVCEEDIDSKEDSELSDTICWDVNIEKHSMQSSVSAFSELLQLETSI